MLQGILIIVVFLVIAALMMTKKIPTLLALPLMAVIICIIAGVPAVGTDAEGNAIGWLHGGGKRHCPYGQRHHGRYFRRMARPVDEQDGRNGKHH